MDAVLCCVVATVIELGTSVVKFESDVCGELVSGALVALSVSCVLVGTGASEVVISEDDVVIISVALVDSINFSVVAFVGDSVELSLVFCDKDVVLSGDISSLLGVEVSSVVASIASVVL